MSERSTDQKSTDQKPNLINLIPSPNPNPVGPLAYTVTLQGSYPIKLKSPKIDFSRSIFGLLIYMIKIEIEMIRLQCLLQH